MAKAVSTPVSVGIIMDGNRRWAKEHGLPSIEGHRRGSEKLHDVVDWCRELGVKELTVYAFSMENWNRAKEEVSYLLDLFRAGIKGQLSRALKKKIRLLFPGNRSLFPEDIRTLMMEAEIKTKAFTEQTLALALSYSGRTEILHAIREIPQEKLKTLTEEEFEQHLWTSELKDPDMIIRTSGEQRLSGFLTWKSVYSELFFTNTYWPAFTKEEFARMLEEYGQRKRRFGT
jgi:undecaprenyl diphosphate synthase